MVRGSWFAGTSQRLTAHGSRLTVQAYRITVRGAGVTVRGSRAWFKYSEVLMIGAGFNGALSKRGGLKRGLFMVLLK
jgi:hypothetical protein